MQEIYDRAKEPGVYFSKTTREGFLTYLHMFRAENVYFGFSQLIYPTLRCLYFLKHIIQFLQSMED